MDFSLRPNTSFQRMHSVIRLLPGFYALLLLLVLHEQPVALTTPAMLAMTGLWFVLVCTAHIVVAPTPNSVIKLIIWHSIDLFGIGLFILNTPAPLSTPLWFVLLLLLVQAGWCSGLSLLMMTLMDVLAATLAMMMRSLMWHEPISRTPLQMLVCIMACTALVAWMISSVQRQAQTAKTAMPRTGLEPEERLYEAVQWLLPFHQRNLTPISLVRLHIGLKPDLSKKERRSLKSQLRQFSAELILKRIRACDVAVALNDGDLVLVLADSSTTAAEALARSLCTELRQHQSFSSGKARCDVAIAPIPAEPVAINLILIKMQEIMQRTRHVTKESPFFVHVDPHIKSGTAFHT